MYDEGLKQGVESHFCMSFLVVQHPSTLSAVGHHAEVELSLWRCWIVEPMKRLVKDSESRVVLPAISVG